MIIDDEPRSHIILEDYIERIPELQLTGSFLNAISAHEHLKTNNVDLIFLDITMPEVDGFSFLRMLDHQPHIIIITAHSEFALESYEYNAVDYLKKPVSFERFTKAVNKVIQQVDHLPGRLTTGQIELKIDREIKTIPFNTIRYFQSLGNYIKVITEHQTYLSQATTQDIERLLPRELFIRIHKSYIVNRSKIEKVNEDTVTIGTIHLPIGKTFKKYVRDSVAK